MFEADRTLGVNRWLVVRLGAHSQTEVVLLASKFFCLTTHYHRCTIPCPGEGCPLCELIASRGLFYAPVFCTGAIRLIELGAQSASYLEQHAKLLHGGMRPGQVFRLTRRGAKHPVHSEIIREQADAKEPSTLTIAQRVMAIYKYPPPNPGETITDYSARCSRLARVRADRIAESILAKSK